jgi:16S rRNA (guanine527-N7)-methyltransferase
MPQILEKFIYGAKQLGFLLTSEQLQRFQLYYEELVKWNKRINLTAITDYEEVQVKHFLDSITLVPAIEKEPWLKEDFLLLDVGTGAGIPGIPLKIILPRVRLFLLESTAKKTAFLKHIVERLDLENVDILTGRAEDIAHQVNYRERFDLVVSRAVAKLSTAAELTIPFCRLGGLFITPKKGQIEGEVNLARQGINILGGRLREERKIDLKGLELRSLVVIEKMGSTPHYYPRRPGIPAKRPL